MTPFDVVLFSSYLTLNNRDLEIWVIGRRSLMVIQDRATFTMANQLERRIWSIERHQFQ